MRKLLALTTAAGALALTGVAASSPSAPAIRARAMTLSVAYSFVGQYTNTQQLGSSFCNVRLTETGDYNGWQRYRQLKLSLESNAQVRSAEQLRQLAGKWAMRGSYYRDNDCRGRPQELDCAGAIRFNARGPHHAAVLARVRGGTVLFSVATGYASIFESDTYALDPTIGSSTPAECLTPLSPYLGLSDVTAPLMRVTAKTTLLRLAKLQSGQKLVIQVKPVSTTSAVDVANCNGTAGCHGRSQHSERLTIARVG